MCLQCGGFVRSRLFDVLFVGLDPPFFLGAKFVTTNLGATHTKVSSKQFYITNMVFKENTKSIGEGLYNNLFRTSQFRINFRDQIESLMTR